MSDAWASIVVALIGVFSTVLMFILSKFRKENREDHNYVRDALSTLHQDMKEIDKKIDGHITWHLKDK